MAMCCVCLMQNAQQVLHSTTCANILAVPPQETLSYMKLKQQRTVYRMTLVKSWNMDEVEEYADLIEVQSRPCTIPYNDIYLLLLVSPALYHTLHVPLLHPTYRGTHHKDFFLCVSLGWIA